MIIDRLAAESEWIRNFCNRSRVVQAPFAVFPPRESNLAVKTSLVPRDGRMICGRFAKPPFDSIVVFGNGDEGREQGALFVHASDIAHAPVSVRDWAPVGTTHVLLVTAAGLSTSFECLASYRFLALCGEHFASPPAMPLARELSSQAFVEVNGFEPERAGAVIQLPEDDWQNFVQHQVGTLAALFALMSCKNVIRSSVVPDRRQQRSRTRSGKIPLFNFSTLRVKPMGGNHRDGNQARDIYWVKGHFKEYTKERPLFGKIAGLFWWEPHLAGARREVEAEPAHAVLIDSV